MIRLCCRDATRSHYSVSVQKRRGKHPFLSVHIDPSDNKYGGKEIRFLSYIAVMKLFQHRFVYQVRNLGRTSSCLMIAVSLETPSNNKKCTLSYYLTLVITKQL